MTIDVGYAHLDLEAGTSIDFVDVPGHDRLIGNMLVGAGEIDAAMLVVAADDGPRAQTLEHLELLDALGIRAGLAVVTKADVVEPGRASEIAGTVAGLLSRTSLAGAPVLRGLFDHRDGHAGAAKRASRRPGSTDCGAFGDARWADPPRHRSGVLGPWPGRRGHGHAPWGQPPRRGRAPARSGRARGPHSRAPGPSRSCGDRRTGARRHQHRRRRPRCHRPRGGADAWGGHRVLVA